MCGKTLIDGPARARCKTACFDLLDRLLSEERERKSRGFRPPKLPPLSILHIVVLAGAFRVGFSALVLEPITDGPVANPQFGSNLSQGVAFRP